MKVVLIWIFRLLRILKIKLMKLIFFNIYNTYSNFIRYIDSIKIQVKNEDNLDEEFYAAKLRQAAHILDKGLYVQKWQKGHGKQWYEKAKLYLKEVAEINGDKSLLWAKKKILQYEEAQKGKLILEKKSIGNFDYLIDYNELYKIIRERRSVRFYNKTSVDLDVIEKIIDTLNWAPNSCNKQTAKVFLTKNETLVEFCLKHCKGATRFGRFRPVFLCFCADLRSYQLPTEMLLPQIDISLGIQNCCLAATSMGLSITLLSWANHTDNDERELRRLLKIPNYYEIIINGLLGYPTFISETPMRKNVKFTYVLR